MDLKKNKKHLDHHLRLCTKNLDDMIYRSWDNESDWLKLVIILGILSFWAIFCPFNSLTTRKINQFWKKWKNLEMSSCYIWVPQINHMMYPSWDAECNRHNFLPLWAIFCLFTPLKTWKIKILKKWNAWRYYHFTHVYHKWKSCDVWFLRYAAIEKMFCHFVSFFPTNNTKNEN